MSNPGEDEDNLIFEKDRVFYEQTCSEIARLKSIEIKLTYYSFLIFSIIGSIIVYLKSQLLTQNDCLYKLYCILLILIIVVITISIYIFLWKTNQFRKTHETIRKNIEDGWGLNIDNRYRDALNILRSPRGINSEHFFYFRIIIIGIGFLALMAFISF